MNKYSVVLSVIWFSLLLVNALGDTEIISSVDTGDAPLTVQFTGSGIDSDGTIASYSIICPNVPSGNFCFKVFI